MASACERSPWRCYAVFHPRGTRSTFLSDPFLDPADDAYIDHAIAALREQGVDLETLGLTRDDLQRRLVQARAERQTPEPTRLPVQPQAHRQMLRRRLDEQIRSASGRVCDALGHRPNARRIAALGGTGAQNNLGAVIVLMNRAVNTHIGIDSNERREQVPKRWSRQST